MTNGYDSERSQFLKYLFEYRDIVLLILLVISGFIWMYKVFATQNQVKALTCLAEQSAYQEISKLKRDLKNDAYIKAQGRLATVIAREKNKNSHDKNEIDELRVEIKNLDEDLEKIDGERAKSLEKIKKQEC